MTETPRVREYRPDPPTVILPKTDAVLRELYAEGKTVREIAMAFSWSREGTGRLLHRMGLFDPSTSRMCKNNHNLDIHGVHRFNNKGQRNGRTCMACVAGRQRGDLVCDPRRVLSEEEKDTVVSMYQLGYPLTRIRAEAVEGDPISPNTIYRVLEKRGITLRSEQE